MHYSKELETAKKAANQASDIVKDYLVNQDFDIKLKSKNDLVTDADLETEKAILEIIRKAFPGDEILAEETAQKQRLPPGRTWLIDPIDGTTNFAHGFPVFCVSIGLWENREPKMAVTLEVNSGVLCWAVKGKGTFWNGTPMEVSSISDPADSLIGTGFPYKDLSLVNNYLKMFESLMHQTQGIRRPGSAVFDLCCVAAGKFDGFYEYSLNAWDVGAAALMIREAGGVVTDWEGKDKWLFGQRIVAGNPEIHAFLLDVIQQHFEDDELKAVAIGSGKFD